MLKFLTAAVSVIQPVQQRVSIAYRRLTDAFSTVGPAAVMAEGWTHGDVGQKGAISGEQANLGNNSLKLFGNPYARY